MELRVLGCHGGESIRHRTSAFLVDGKLALDAGAITSMLALEDQLAVEAVLVSHAHLDHVRDLATLADNRLQQRGRPLVIAGIKETLDALKKHFFNDVLWPDFAKIPGPDQPTILYQELVPEVPQTIAGLTARAVLVSHTIDACGFVVQSDGAALAYSGDTGPTSRLWEVLADVPELRALLMEVSFPNDHDWLARASGHHTPASLALELQKLGARRDLPVLLYHIKPVFEAVVERELAKLPGSSLEVCRLGDQYVL